MLRQKDFFYWCKKPGFYYTHSLVARLARVLYSSVFMRPIFARLLQEFARLCKSSVFIKVFTVWRFSQTQVLQKLYRDVQQFAKSCKSLASSFFCKCRCSKELCESLASLAKIYIKGGSSILTIVKACVFCIHKLHRIIQLFDQ